MKSSGFATKILQRRLGDEFDSQSVLRGSSYFVRGAVTELFVSARAASARIIGTRAYETELSWENAGTSEKILGRCSCPYFVDGFHCKHLWALILELDRRGLSEKIPAQNPWVFQRNTKTFSEEPLASPPPVAEGAVPESLSSGFEPGKSASRTAKNWRQVFQNQPPISSSGSTSKEFIPAFAAEIVLRQVPFILLEADRRNDHFVTLKFFMADVVKNHIVSTVRPLPLPSSGGIKLSDPDPHFESAMKAVALLATAESKDTFRHRGFFHDPCARSFRLQSLRFLLKSLLDTGKVFASKEDFLQSVAHATSMALSLVEFNDLKLQVTPAENGYSLGALIEIKPSSTPETASLWVPLSELESVVDMQLVRWKNKIGFLDLPAAQRSWFEELRQSELFIPADDVEAFLESMYEQSLTIDLPEALRWERREVAPEVKLHLKADRTKSETESALVPPSGRYLVDLRFQYGPKVVSVFSQGVELASAEDRRVYVRNPELEAKTFRQLPMDLLIKKSRRGRQADFPEEFDSDTYCIEPKNLFLFVKQALAAGIPVMVENKRLQESKDLRMSVHSGVDWFEVEGQADFDGRWVRFPDILAALSKGESFVPLQDGSLGLISEEMKEKLLNLSRFGEVTQQGLRFGRSQALLLDSLLEAESRVQLDESFRRLKQKIKKFSGVQTAQPAKSFHGELRTYQQEGLGWLKFLEAFELGGILADDMGLGKTIQCLAFLDERRASHHESPTPSLLLAPKSLLQNWMFEANKFTPELKVHIHAGLDREKSIEFFQHQDLIITTYQTMLRDIDSFREIHWDCLILDEAQAIKNAGALISKASKLLPARFRLAMTGTPIENSLQDLFSISDFVNPGFLSGKKRNAHLTLDDETRMVLQRAFKPVMLRRTKDQVLKDLPEKTEQMISVELEARQLKVYNDLKKFYQGQLLQDIQVNGVNNSKIKILAALTRLRQAALHPGLIDPSHDQIKCAKFEAVLEMLDEVIAEGHRVLIFSQFTSLLALLKRELDQKGIKYSYLDGQSKSRQQIVEDFKNLGDPVFLMSLKAGGVGLNLVEADYVFLLDPWWNPAVETQAIDRVHRIGQKRAVNAYRFIAKDTVEEKILELQKSKRNLSNEVFKKEDSLLQNLSARDIESLFS